MKPRTLLIVGLWVVALVLSGGVLLAYLNRTNKDVAQEKVVLTEGATQNPVSPASPSSLLVSGVITVAPELVDRSRQISTVYVMIRPDQGGAPFAVARLENSRAAELPFELTLANVMVQGAQPPPNAKIVVRFDADSRAGPEQPGDLVGELSPVQMGSTQLNVVVSKQVMP